MEIPGSTATLAPVARRTLGELVDGVVVAGLMLLVVFELARRWDVGLDQTISTGHAVTALVLLLLPLLVPPVCSAATDGRTPGKLVAGTRVVRANGAGVDLAFALKRELWTKNVTCGLGWRWLDDWRTMVADPQLRSRHDQLLGTLVVSV